MLDWIIVSLAKCPISIRTVFLGIVPVLRCFEGHLQIILYIRAKEQCISESSSPLLIQASMVGWMDLLKNFRFRRILETEWSKEGDPRIGASMNFCNKGILVFKSIVPLGGLGGNSIGNLVGADAVRNLVSGGQRPMVLLIFSIFRRNESCLILI